MISFTTNQYLIKISWGKQRPENMFFQYEAERWHGIVNVILFCLSYWDTIYANRPMNLFTWFSYIANALQGRNIEIEIRSDKPYVSPEGIRLIPKLIRQTADDPRMGNSSRTTDRIKIWCYSLWEYPNKLWWSRPNALMYNGNLQ